MIIYKTNEELQTFSEKRKERASELLTTSVPERVDATTYLVPSSDGSKKYKVSHIDTYSCECPDFLQRCKGQGLYCKHIQSIILFNKLKNKVEMDDFQVEDITDEKICPKCKSENITLKGTRKNKSGTKQRYKCHNCFAYFVIDPTKGVKGNARMVCLAMDMYYKGNSLRDIQDTIYQSFGLKLHHETIRRWNNRFMAKKCKNGSTCYIASGHPAGEFSKASLRKKLTTPADRAEIPYGLSLAMCKAMEKDLGG